MVTGLDTEQSLSLNCLCGSICGLGGGEASVSKTVRSQEALWLSGGRLAS
jgi:hypothetical protein